MQRKTLDVAGIYRTVANVMPSEGRDFALDTVSNASGDTVVVVTPKSPVGEAWVPFLRDAISETLAHDATQVQIVHTPSAEEITIAELRKRAIAETAATLDARIAATKRDIAEKQKVHKSLLELQPPADKKEIKDAEIAVSDAQHIAYKVAHLPEKVAAVRMEIDNSAAEAANPEDAIDPDAALTSMFDKYDVADRLKYKEQCVVQIAQHAVDIDELKRDAIETVKTIALDKHKE